MSARKAVLLAKIEKLERKVVRNKEIHDADYDSLHEKYMVKKGKRAAAKIRHRARLDKMLTQLNEMKVKYALMDDEWTDVRHANFNLEETQTAMSIYMNDLIIANEGYQRKIKEQSMDMDIVTARMVHAESRVRNFDAKLEQTLEKQKTEMKMDFECRLQEEKAKMKEAHEADLKAQKAQMELDHKKELDVQAAKLPILKANLDEFHKADLESKLDAQRIFLTQKKRYELQNQKMRLEAAYQDKMEEMKDQMTADNEMSQINLELEYEIHDLKLEIIDIKSSHDEELAREHATFYDAGIESRRKMADLRCEAANLKFEVSDLEAELKDQKIKISSLETQLKDQKVKNSNLEAKLKNQAIKNSDFEFKIENQIIESTDQVEAFMKDEQTGKTPYTFGRLFESFKPRDDEDEDNETDSDTNEATETTCEESSGVEDQEKQDHSSTSKFESKLGEIAPRKRKTEEEDIADPCQEGSSEAKIPKIQDALELL